MKTIYIYCIIIISYLLFVSCTQNPYMEDLGNPAGVPKKKTAAPVVSRFTGTDGLDITWNTHKDARSYRLYRSLSPGMKEKELVYAGHTLSYRDTACENAVFYYYRLVCESDKITYSSSDSAGGIYCTGMPAEQHNAAQLSLNTHETFFISHFDNNNGISRDTTYTLTYAGNTIPGYLSFNYNPDNATPNTRLCIDLMYGGKSAGNTIRINNNMGIMIDPRDYGIESSEGNGPLVIQVSTEKINDIHTGDYGYFSVELGKETFDKGACRAEVQSGRVVLSYDTTDDLSEYHIYRREANTDFVKIHTAAGNYTVFTDDSVKADTEYRYYLSLTTSGGAVKETGASNVIYIKSATYDMSDTLTATILEEGGRISLVWEELAGADGYTVHKYTALTDTAPALIRVSTATYTDTSCDPSVPYYYRVAAIKNNRHYHPSPSYVMGLANTTADIYEPANNEQANLVDQAHSSIFIADEPPVFYAFNGISDSDWYKYRGTYERLAVKIIVPDDLAVNAGELLFSFYTGDENHVSEVVTSGTNYFIYPDINSSKDEIDVYFRLYAEAQTAYCFEYSFGFSDAATVSDPTDIPDTDLTDDVSSDSNQSSLKKDVLVAMIDDTAQLTIDTTHDLKNFIVYRKAGTASFEEIHFEAADAFAYTDTAIVPDTLYQYYVILLYADGTAVKTNLSTPVYLMSESFDMSSDSLTASRLQYSTKIVLDWQGDERVDSYRVYRYTTPGGSDVHLFETVEAGYTDTAIIPDTPYYYRVAAIKDGYTYAASPSYILGMAASQVDLYEPENDTSGDVSDESQSTNFNPLYPPTLYNYDSGKQSDSDWYKYHGEPSPFIVKVELPLDIVTAGEVVFTYWYDNSSDTMIVNPGINYFVYNPPLDLTADTIDVLFNLACPAVTRDLLVTYAIDILRADGLSIDEELSVPLTATAGDTGITLEYPSPPATTGYFIFKKTGDAAFTEIAYNSHTGEGSITYTDTTIITDVECSYYFLCIGNDGSIRKTVLSNVVYIQSTQYVIDGNQLEASILSYAGESKKITLSWPHIEGVDSYKVYRYLSKSDITPVSFTTQSNNYTDTAIEANTPYFYRIACIRLDREYRECDTFTYGIAGNRVDYYEPDNNDFSTLSSDESSLFDAEYPPLIYSFSDGAGDTIYDDDWYLFKCSPLSAVVKINLPVDSPFTAGELFFQFYYAGEYKEVQPVGMGDTYFIFNDFGDATGTVDLYFKVSPTVSTALNKIGTYTITASNGL